MRGPAGPGASLACIPGRQAPFPWMDAVLWSQVEALVSVPPSPPSTPLAAKARAVHLSASVCNTEVVVWPGCPDTRSGARRAHAEDPAGHRLTHCVRCRPRWGGDALGQGHPWEEGSVQNVLHAHRQITAERAPEPGVPRGQVLRGQQRAR